MSITDSLTLLFESLVDTTIFVLNELIDHIYSHPVSFFSIAAAAFAAYVVLSLFNFKFSGKGANQKFEIMVYIFSPLIFLTCTYYAERLHQGNPLLAALNYLGFYWLTAVLMKIPSRFFGVRLKFQYAPSLILIFLGLGISLYLKIAGIYTGTPSSELKSAFELAWVIAKLFFVLGYFVYIKGVLPQGLRILKESYPVLDMFKNLARLIMTAYLVVSVLWLFGFISLDFRAVVAVALLGMLLALLSYIFYRVQDIINYFYHREHYTELEWTLIKKNLMRLIYMVFIYIYYVLIYNSLDMRATLEKLKATYLFETKLFSLSLLSLISAVMLFVFLKSLLFLFTRYLRVLFYDRELADDSDSMEIIVYNLGLLLVFMATMLQLGVTWQIVVPIAGALGIGIGFGLQTVINNYICGFILLFSKKVRIGDFVELPGSAGSVVGVNSDMVFGKIVSIDMFATTVQTYDNIEIMVPNSIFISETIINYTRSDKYIRVRVPVGIAYSSDIDLAQKLMYEAIDDCSFVVQSKGNDVWFMEYGESSLNFMVLFWLDMTEGFMITKVKNIFLTSLWHKFKEHDIEIPFPQSDVWFRNELHIGEKSGKEKD